MRLFELFEPRQPKDLVVIYPGRFQPFHQGHKAVYDYLTKKYGQDRVWIVTSDKVDPPRSPFSFKEKLEMITTTGVDASRVVFSSQPYQARELLTNYDPERTVVIFAVSKKDMAEDPRFSFRPKRDGSPSYFQPLPHDINAVESFAYHGYITTVPTFDFEVLGQPVRSASEIRSLFAKADDETQKTIVKELFGKFNPRLYRLMQHKITEQAGVGVVAANRRMARDPRYSTSMTQDVRPDTPKKNLRAFRLA